MPNSPRLKRTLNFPVRLNQLELEMIRMKASDAGLTCAELLRRNALMRPLPKRFSKISIATYQELRRIGNNLNQLVKASNTAVKMGYPPPADPATLEQLLTLLNNIGRQLTQAHSSDDELEDQEEELEDDWEAD
jgi:hypothetical protein